MRWSLFSGTDMNIAPHLFAGKEEEEEEGWRRDW